MKFFERFRGEDETGVRDLHKDFKIHEGSWYHNRSYTPLAGEEPVIKIRFSFDDPILLDDCPFMAKIGLNQDPAVYGKYVGFAYGQNKDREALTSWAQKFNFAELIVDLDQDGVSTPENKVTPIEEKREDEKQFV
ncbi:MAG: hypothetical protein WC523_00935 [Patescibacteria group bacterium]